MRIELGIVGAALCLLAPATGHAFTVKSGLTDGCHEKVTVVAYLQALPQVPVDLDMYVPGGAWEEVADYLLRDAHYEPETRAEKFFLFSLLTGVRAPDNEGFSLSNISTLRAIHDNPQDQYHHCLRSVDDDGLAGNEQAVAGCRDALLEQLTQASEQRQKPWPEQVQTRPFTLDQYGTFKVEVWSPAYYLGRALHALEDSFSHTLRTLSLRGVIHVMNYAEAIGGTLREERDGLPHASATDLCHLVTADPARPSNKERVFAAEEAAADLLRAVAPTLAGVRMSSPEVALVLDKWLDYVPGEQLGFAEGCVKANDYCHSPWLELARLRPSKPILGCHLACFGGADYPASGALLLGMVLVARRARRRR
jgi:hypothetical protein